ncbi:MAG: hypothetical protein AAGI46_02715 [Planctomycetota bacterium]
MPLDVDVRRQLRDLLGDGRLADDARRLWRRTSTLAGKLRATGRLNNEPDADALEIACWALQLPMRTVDPAQPVGGPGGLVNLRDRCEGATHQLVDHLGEQLPADLLDRTARLLHETPQRPPVLEEAKLLADATNLDDFGSVGLLSAVARQGSTSTGAGELARSFIRRQEYGYWQARLADGFHFTLCRSIAKRRLDNARRLIDTLLEELAEDGVEDVPRPPGRTPTMGP